MDSKLEQTKPKQKRRTKISFEGNLLHCGCGRKYMSYPALSSHIKSKHEGVPPQGTSSKPAPKPVQTVQKTSKIRCGCGRSYVSYSSLNAHIKSSHQGIPPDGTDIRPQKKKKKTPSVQFLQANSISGTTPHPQYIVDPNHRLAYLLTNHSRTSLCDDVFAIYLWELSQVVDQETFRVFCGFTADLYSCLNQVGWDMVEKEAKGSFCEVESSYYIPKVGNYFCQVYMPFVHQEVDWKNLKVYFQHLCLWLFEKKHTEIQIKKLFD